MKVEIDTSELLSHLVKIRTDNELMDRALLGLQSMKVFYEDLIENEDEETRKILKYIEAEYSQLKSPLLKINPHDIRQILKNFDEVAKTLKNTAYEWCLK